jgi:hypothetical protein
MAEGQDARKIAFPEVSEIEGLGIIAENTEPGQEKRHERKRRDDPAGRCIGRKH